MLTPQPERWFHGYEMAQTLSMKSGTLYPLLIRLEGEGWLESRWDDSTPRRHLYRLSDQGKMLAAGWLERHPQRVQMLKGVFT
ncbi:hypothetical protein DC3_14180 [Deinococcus cellulosilyticus NBRC 106333 = KACC 11606]|uniref:Transcription regulator PadR N-terminal domain-containing protein n=1 Tax=Deinococcus cellulosilyticus (strain DSM 18568 / NBRC 106333 / KACC 11606 / 5516J-15) TaxID=1223518 RepID=A0A511MYX7_DEIC1|nr:hypothetical protein DC3_14180 [Deinococcus cellulosilyticus NBRC 106333 = KACC 11606]